MLRAMTFADHCVFESHLDGVLHKYSSYLMYLHVLVFQPIE